MADITTHGAAGPPITVKDTILETGASATQSFAPLRAICAHLNAFHVYSSDISRSVEANHYCTHLSADVRTSVSLCFACSHKKLSSSVVQRASRLNIHLCLGAAMSYI